MTDMPPELRAMLDEDDHADVLQIRNTLTVAVNPAVSVDAAGPGEALAQQAVDRLERKLAEALRKLAGWRQGAQDVAAEECPETDRRMHCTCVAPLRAGLARLRKALTEVQADRERAMAMGERLYKQVVELKAERDALQAKREPGDA